MIALHGVEVIQKQNSNQAAHVVPINIFIKPAFMDTENNCWYYEIIGINNSDVLTHCSAQNLPLKKPNSASLSKFHKKYDAKKNKNIKTNIMHGFIQSTLQPGVLQV